MNQRAKKIKSSPLENSSARSLNDSRLTNILSQVGTKNETLYELRDCKGALTRRTKDDDASVTTWWIYLQVEKIRVESE